MKARETMYQCIKQYGSIKTGSFWEVERYIVNSDGERIKVIIANEDNLLLLSMTEFENHFAQANKPLTEQEWLQTATTEQLAEWFVSCGFLTCPLHNCDDCIYYDKKNDDCYDITDHKQMWIEWLKQPHKK